LNHRYSYKLPTIITTNVDIDQLDPRLRSRILHDETTARARIVAPDYRTSVINESQQMLSNLNLYRDMTFDTFQIERNLNPRERENLERAVDLALAYANGPQGWLVLMGSYGSGKTHLAAAIANHIEMHGGKASLVTVPDLLDYLRVTFDPAANTSFDQRFQRVRKADFLVLDDLGTENATSWVREKLFQILDYRYVARLPTVITSGKSLDEIDPRIRTRLLDSRRCHLFALTVESYAQRRKRR
jgi:DNA replication protein DnaC